MEPKKVRSHKNKKWIVCGLLLAVIFVTVLGIVIWESMSEPREQNSCTLPGADEIYPTVMVDGKLYEWRKGSAICDEIPVDYSSYGTLTHVKKNSPENDCEFASTFEVSGEIYAKSGEGCVYLRLVTEWLDQTVVVFDLKETD